MITLRGLGLGLLPPWHPTHELACIFPPKTRGTSFGPTMMVFLTICMTRPTCLPTSSQRFSLNAWPQANPWSALKALVNRRGKTFQFFTKDELQAYVAQKAADKHGAQISIKKKHSKKPPQKQTPLQLHPAALSLLAGHFVDAEDDDVPQIQFSQVTPDMRGIAIGDLPKRCPTSKTTPV